MRGERKLRQRGEFSHKADAIESADIDQFQLETFGRNQLALHAAPRPDKSCVMPALAQLARHGKPRNHVPAGAARRH